MQNHTYSAGKTALTIFGLGTAYAAALAHLERRYPIKPDHTWAEVAGGVIITLAPVIAARRRHKLSVCQFEELLMLAFIASGTPIILWQIAESLLRSGSIGTPAERRLRYELRNLPVSTLARLCHRAQRPYIADSVADSAVLTR